MTSLTVTIPRNDEFGPLHSHHNLGFLLQNIYDFFGSKEIFVNDVIVKWDHNQLELEIFVDESIDNLKDDNLNMINLGYFINTPQGVCSNFILFNFQIREIDDNSSNSNSTIQDDSSDDPDKKFEQLKLMKENLELQSKNIILQKENISNKEEKLEQKESQLIVQATELSAKAIELSEKSTLLVEERKQITRERKKLFNKISEFKENRKRSKKAFDEKEKAFEKIRINNINYLNQQKTDLEKSIRNVEFRENEVRERENEISSGIMKMKIFTKNYQMILMREKELKKLHQRYFKISKNIQIAKETKKALHSELESLNEKIDDNSEIKELNMIKDVISNSLFFSSFNKKTILVFLNDISQYLKKHFDMLEKIKKQEIFKKFTNLSNNNLPDMLDTLINKYNQIDTKLVSVSKELSNIKKKKIFEKPKPVTDELSKKYLSKIKELATKVKNYEVRMQFADDYMANYMLPLVCIFLSDPTVGVYLEESYTRISLEIIGGFLSKNKLDLIKNPKTERFYPRYWKLVMERFRLEFICKNRYVTTEFGVPNVSRSYVSMIMRIVDYLIPHKNFANLIMSAYMEVKETLHTKLKKQFVKPDYAEILYEYWFLVNDSCLSISFKKYLEWNEDLKNIYLFKWFTRKFVNKDSKYFNEFKFKNKDNNMLLLDVFKDICEETPNEYLTEYKNRLPIDSETKDENVLRYFRIEISKNMIYYQMFVKKFNNMNEDEKDDLLFKAFEKICKREENMYFKDFKEFFNNELVETDHLQIYYFGSEYRDYIKSPDNKYFKDYKKKFDEMKPSEKENEIETLLNVQLARTDSNAYWDEVFKMLKEKMKDYIFRFSFQASDYIKDSRSWVCFQWNNGVQKESKIYTPSLIFSNQDKNYDLGKDNLKKLIKCVKRAFGKEFNNYVKGIGLEDLQKVR